MPTTHRWGRRPADNGIARTVVGIGPVKRIKATLSTGRSFDESQRQLDSCQLTATKKGATPANSNWARMSSSCQRSRIPMLQRSIPDGWQSLLPYISIVPLPM